MKTLTALTGTLIPATALAAANMPAENDGIFIWIFLGFFALVVVGQLIPAIMLLTGMLKGVRAKTEAKTEVR
jgi:hypothetical protein